ncbi:protein ACCELERATED CELL DEATH 6-like [Neltuma alba]|uniref:protein ACCELERATED CELL DEATH 6-like n=1 Tax=Neltuma alba TaxID=207710 RepID=UPI0010A4AC92|nr:protein ACCELERATED CELL DEATH 6-like [Prosopis alba]
MGQYRSGFNQGSRLKHKLMKQEHGPSKDFNLLKVAYDPNGSFTVSDNAFFKQRTPLGNTVLHLAASDGNDARVKEVAQHAPQLFTAINNNYDTVLHVAARMGHGSTIKLILNEFLLFARRETNGHDDHSILEMMLLVSLTLFRNKQGNTFLHEAFMTNSRNGAVIFKAFEASFSADGGSDFEAEFKRITHHLAPFAVNVEGKSLLYLTIEVNCDRDLVEQLMEFCIEDEPELQGRSPLLPTLIKKNFDMLGAILSKKPDWIHLRDEEGWFPLHSAARLGYLQGVSSLVEKCPSCTMERDNNGYLPIHLACVHGHVEIVQELLNWCLDPTEIVTERGQNLLHVACKYGNYEVVRYLLKQPKLEVMINQKDMDGNTPLHLATESRHPKIVYALTWDNRVDLSLLNRDNLTALDIVEVYQSMSISLSERLTWNALISAGAPRSSVRFHPDLKSRIPTTEQYKDRIDTLMVVSTLIIITSFAAGFTIPGDEDQGIPFLLKHRVFHLFILSLTISVFGAISSTIILIWGRLGDLHLAVFALTCAVPLLSLSLTALSVAVLAGMYLVVSKLSWLATIFLLIGVVLILVVVFLYLLLLLPSSSTLPFFRYISYYPFLFFANIAQGKMDANKMRSKAIVQLV